MTIREVADFLRAHDNYLVLTHIRPDGDTLGCAAGLCAMLREMGKSACMLKNRGTTAHYMPYVEPYLATEDYAYDTVVSVDVAATNMLPLNAEPFIGRIDLVIDHHPSNVNFGRENCVMPEHAACGEILTAIAEELGVLTPAVALPLYVAVSTDTGCFVYSNVTPNTHRVAATLMATGIDYRTANKKHFRTKSKKRLALEAALLGSLEYFDENRIVVVQLPKSLVNALELSEEDMDDISALGGLVEGTDCSITMKETDEGAWKVSLRTGERVNATKVCARFGGGGHRAASGCIIRDMGQEAAKLALVNAVLETVKEEN